MEGMCCKRLMRSLVVVTVIVCVLMTRRSSCAEGSGRVGYQLQEESTVVFIRRSCSSTTYPALCYSSLVKHAGLIHTDPLLLTGTALNVTLSCARSTSAAMSSLAKTTTRGLKPREVGAMKDCVEELSDSVEELRRSMGEMGELRRRRTADFELTMSDVQTWVSAALTDESTCTDGLGDDVKIAVRGTIVELAQLTSNALAFINQLANSHRP